MSDNNITGVSEWIKKDRATLDCPTGARVVVRRITLHRLVYSGRLPDALLGDYMAGLEHFANSDLKKLTVEDIKAFPVVYDGIVIGSLESPRATLEASDPEKGIVNVREIPDEDRDFIVGHALAGSPAIPVQMKDGSEASVDSLRSFREGSELSNAGNGSGEAGAERGAPVGA